MSFNHYIVSLPLNIQDALEVIAHTQTLNNSRYLCQNRTKISDIILRIATEFGNTIQQNINYWEVKAVHKHK